MIRFQRPHYDYAAMKQQRQTGTLQDGFVVEFTLRPGAFSCSRPLFTIPGVLECTVRTVPRPGTGYGDPAFFDRVQHYNAYRVGDQPLRVLEARLFLHSWKTLDYGWEALRLGIPECCIPDDGTAAVFALCYTGVRLVLLRNGDILDEILPFGAVKPDGDLQITAPDAVDATLYCSSRRPVIQYREQVLPVSAEFYAPPWFNAWVGDIVPLYHDGRFHIFYLLDRRHHSSRFCCGSHYFAHLSTTDLKNWTEHEPAIDIEQQWQTCGTGVPFFHRGQYYFCHGWHTNRALPEQECFYEMQTQACEAGKFTPIDTRDFPDRFPSGATYSVSDDGIHYTQSGILVHLAENPSVYPQADGSLLMMTGSGTWRADSMQDAWTLLDPDFPRSGPQTAMHNTLECPSWFEWNGWRYLIMGVTGFWSAAPGADFEDSAARGYDIYDGLAVPMAAPFRDNRMILAGWFLHAFGCGWGSLLILRELIQYSDGHLGMKWVPEAMPEIGAEVRRLERMAPEEWYEIDGQSDGYYQMTVDPGAGGGRLALRFRDAESGGFHEFRMDFDREVIQFSTPGGDWFGPEVLPVHEAMARERDQLGDACGWFIPIPNRPWAATDFALAHVDVMKQPFTLRIYRRVEPKLPATIFDIEVAQARTMLSVRAERTMSALRFESDDPAVTVTAYRECAKG